MTPEITYGGGAQADVDEGGFWEPPGAVGGPPRPWHAAPRTAAVTHRREAGAYDHFIGSTDEVPAETAWANALTRLLAELKCGGSLTQDHLSCPGEIIG